MKSITRLAKWCSSRPSHLALIQAFLVLACTGFQPLRLSYWDSGWYRGLVNVGYSSSFPDGHGNVGFFPGYPVAAYLLKTALGFGKTWLSTDAALLLTALAFAFLMWRLLTSWLELWNPSQEQNRTRLVLFALYPFSFFFYAAYSESLFAATVIGFMLFSERWIRKDRSLALTLLFGFGMCFTRLLGFAFILYPVFRALQVRKKRLSSLGVAAFSALGGVLFFVYCQIKFSAWNFYFISERTIWGTYFDWHKLIPPTQLFHLTPPFKGDIVGRVVTIAFGFFLTRKLFLLLRTRRFETPIFALILVSGMYWGANLLGRTSWDYIGMGRYLLPGLALMLPWMDLDWKKHRAWLVIALFFLALQIGYIITFAHRGWVA